MRRNLFKAAFALALLAVIPAKADDAAFKKQLDALAVSYTEAFNKKDAAGIAALYTSDGQLVNALGVHKGIAATFEAQFKAGLDHLDAKTEQAHLLDPKVGFGQGTFHQTGKTADGKPIDVTGWWTATYIDEGGKWKIKILTAVPKPAPAK